LADWIYGSIDLGYVLTKELIREKALEMIIKENAKFKCSDSWMEGFFERHHFSLRKLNQQAPAINEHLTEISQKFCRVVREEIKKYKIKSSHIINMDESPFFWEYLPRKIVTPQMSRDASGWKKGYTRARSTLVLAASADGHLLRPSLVLKRETPYMLKCQNDISLHLMNSGNGWIDEDLAIEWLENVLLPYVKKEHCLLLWDSFEGHTSSNVFQFLNKHPNIHVAVIVGGTTAFSQPLDISINKKFKAACRKYSVEHSNLTLKVMNQSNAIAQNKSIMSQNILKGNKNHYVSFIC